MENILETIDATGDVPCSSEEVIKVISSLGDIIGVWQSSEAVLHGSLVESLKNGFCLLALAFHVLLGAAGLATAV